VETLVVFAVVLKAELVTLQVDVLVTTGTPAAVAAKQATSTIPIVIVAASDPVGARLVSTLISRRLV
jgi:ABC-type uncharacterized transport system substrate-binding protein